MKSSPDLSGTWVSIDDTTTVEIVVRKNSKEYSVSAADTYDGEVAAVSEVGYDKSQGILSFATYWTSTGRFTRYRMQSHAPAKVEITYTHTDSEILIRKNED